MNTTRSFSTLAFVAVLVLAIVGLVWHAPPLLATGKSLDSLKVQFHSTASIFNTSAPLADSKSAVPVAYVTILKMASLYGVRPALPTLFGYNLAASVLYNRRC